MYRNVCLASLGLVGVAILLPKASSITAVAGPTVCDSVGPDVIVGVIPDVSNYASFGGIEAFAIGTTSCNIGDQILDWIANSNQHPVIGQNLFRLKNGRFEQIGQAWLKHGFAALQGNACGCGCSPSDGSHLGVGCSDPYSSGLNGAQSGMGPKFEVDANTGFFPWPPTDFNNTGNSIYKRLQAKISDIDPAQDGGGLYFVEAHYVHPDDATFGNQDNNTSYRPCTISGGGANWTMSLSGATEREATGIDAWKAHDALVNVRSVSVPNEGLFKLGWKVTDLGGGQWDYEFALQNVNSDRSAGGFVVPLPLGATISSTGFHDVDYHSGEPFDGTDWPATVLSSEIAWRTTPHSQNPNANALRWGTLYNYRFVADVDPSLITEIQIELFKPGLPAAVVVPLIGDGPPNDDCGGAITVAEGTTAFTTLNTTTDGPDEGAVCSKFGYTQIDSDVWFRYTPICTGTVTVSLCGSSYDTKMAVYSGGCPTGPNQAIACNDDFCGLQSEVAFPATAGELLLIRIGGFQGAQGTGTLFIACDGVIKNNDLCQGALPITTGQTAFDTTGANTDGPAHPECQFDGQTYNDIWYTFDATCTGTLTVSTCSNAFYDTDLVVYDGCDCANLILLGCNDDAPGCAGFTSEVSVPVTGGLCYLVRVGGWNAGDQGAGTLTLTCAGTPFTDCNGNGIDDAIDIANGTSQDCNNNTVPDECDIADGTSQDCDGGPVGVAADGAVIWNSICFACHGPDGSGGIGPDIRNFTRVQLWNQLLPPTNHAGGSFPNFTQQDFADLEAFLDTIGGSGGRPDLIPDECQTLGDCDGDGIADACELEAGTQSDLDFDGIPDDCQAPCPADFNGDVVVDTLDLLNLLAVWGSCPGCPQDLNGDNVVDVLDLLDLIAQWGNCP